MDFGKNFVKSLFEVTINRYSLKCFALAVRYRDTGSDRTFLYDEQFLPGIIS